MFKGHSHTPHAGSTSPQTSSEVLIAVCRSTVGALRPVSSGTRWTHEPAPASRPRETPTQGHNRVANLQSFLLAIVAGTAFNESRQRLDLKSKVPCTLAFAVVTCTSIAHLRVTMSRKRRIPVRASGQASPCWLALASVFAPLVDVHVMHRPRRRPRKPRGFIALERLHPFAWRREVNCAFPAHAE